MNKRIQELAEQSTTIVDQIGAQGYASSYARFDREKFAGLIVEDCLNVALEQKKWVENQEVFNPRDIDWNKARIQQSQHIVDKIKQHFGVEQ